MTISGAVSGSITYDYGSSARSPYESWIGQFSVDQDLQRQVRGYYWGNFLNARHVDMLGGAKVVKSAPVQIIEEVADGYYLQINDDIGKLRRSDVLKLKKFLAPIMPRREPDNPPYDLPYEFLI
jgi:hypothetical protein